MVAPPFVTAVTKPDELTVALLRLDDDQVNVLPGTVFQFTSWALAVSWTVSPTETSV